MQMNLNRCNRLASVGFLFALLLLLGSGGCASGVGAPKAKLLRHGASIWSTSRL